MGSFPYVLRLSVANDRSSLEFPLSFPHLLVPSEKNVLALRKNEKLCRVPLLATISHKPLIFSNANEGVFNLETKFYCFSIH